MSRLLITSLYPRDLWTMLLHNFDGVDSPCTHLRAHRKRPKSWHHQPPPTRWPNGATLSRIRCWKAQSFLPDWNQFTLSQNNKSHSTLYEHDRSLHKACLQLLSGLHAVVSALWRVSPKSCQWLPSVPTSLSLECHCKFWTSERNEWVEGGLILIFMILCHLSMIKTLFTVHRQVLNGASLWI